MRGVVIPAAIARAAGFLALWVALAGALLADLPAVALAVGAATWTSLRLLPPGIETVHEKSATLGRPGRHRARDLAGERAERVARRP